MSLLFFSCVVAPAELESARISAIDSKSIMSTKFHQGAIFLGGTCAPPKVRKEGVC